MTVNKNDWIRFYSQGKLVVGCVEYIANDKEGNGILITDVGTCSPNAIIEIRKPVIDTKDAIEP